MDSRPAEQPMIKTRLSYLFSILAIAWSCGNDTSTAAIDGSPPPDAAASDAQVTSAPTIGFQEIALPGDMGYHTEFRFLPGTSEILLVEIDGDIHHLRIDDDALTLLGSFSIPVYSSSSCGALSLAVDPNFQENSFLYVGHCTSKQHSAITRFVFDSSNYDEIASTAAPIISVGDDAAEYPWHNVGSIGFDADGYLWALFGEKALGSPAQDLTNNLGTLVRIVPNREPQGSGYAPAPNNPFIGPDDGMSDDVIAFGLRSPWRGTLDSLGRYWIADVGGSQYEELNVLLTGPGAQRNFGWPMQEGAICDDDSCASLFRLPVAAWSHATDDPYVLEDPETVPTNSRVAYVGSEYVPTSIDRYEGFFTGKIPFGDSCTGWVRLAELSSDGEVVADTLVANLPNIAAWEKGYDDYLYVLTLSHCNNSTTGAGKIWRVVLES